jgi:hypothetical protein
LPNASCSFSGLASLIRPSCITPDKHTQVSSGQKTNHKLGDEK